MVDSRDRLAGVAGAVVVAAGKSPGTSSMATAVNAVLFMSMVPCSVGYGPWEIGPLHSKTRRGSPLFPGCREFLELRNPVGGHRPSCAGGTTQRLAAGTCGMDGGFGERSGAYVRASWIGRWLKLRPRLQSDPGFDLQKDGYQLVAAARKRATKSSSSGRSMSEIAQ
jgi:hypothetical protein